MTIEKLNTQSDWYFAKMRLTNKRTGTRPLAVGYGATRSEAIKNCLEDAITIKELNHENKIN